MLLCASVPDYLVAVSLLVLPPSDVPTLVADRIERGHILATDDVARSAGARIGQTVTQAVAAVPNARVVAYDAERGRRVWEEVLEAFDALTPLIDDTQPGRAFLDMRGVPGNTAGWRKHAQDIARRYGLALKLGLGVNKFCAFAATWIGDGTTLEIGRERTLLAPLPLEVLGLDVAVRDRLQVLGILTLGDIARLPHGPFVRRFGREAARWHDCACGVDRSPFMPRGHSIAIEAAIFGEGRAEDEAQVVFALRVLLARVCADLAACGKRSGALELQIELENGEQSTLELLLALPTADERMMLDLLRAKLENRIFTSPIVGLRVRALRLEEGGESLQLFSAEDIDAQNVAVTLARLEASLGEPARRARLHSAHPLEERFSYEPFVLTRDDMRRLPDLPEAETPPEIVPQLRLLSVREIDVRLRAGEPAFVGSPPRAVLECAGPWRIDTGWFAAPIARDEYDVVLEGGEIYRIYHQGSRWYLRGAYD